MSNVLVNSTVFIEMTGHCRKESMVTTALQCFAIALTAECRSRELDSVTLGLATSFVLIILTLSNTTREFPNEGKIKLLFLFDLIRRE